MYSKFNLNTICNQLLCEFCNWILSVGNSQTVSWNNNNIFSLNQSLSGLLIRNFLMRLLYLIIK